MANEVETNAILNQLDDQGFAIMNNFLAPDLVDAARAEVMLIVEEHAQKLMTTGAIKDLYVDESFETRFIRIHKEAPENAPDHLRKELHRPGLYDIFFNQTLLDIVENVLGPEIRLYPNYTVRPKMPDQPKTDVLWHQDAGYTEYWHKSGSRDVSKLRMMNLWTPLVPAHVENGAMQFIAGSHKMDLFRHEQREYYLEIPDEPIYPHSDRIVDIEVDPCDLILFSNMLCHRGPPNKSDGIRWNIDWRYQDATQPTMREEEGHIARSQKYPDSVIRNQQEWANLSSGYTYNPHLGGNKAKSSIS